MNTQKHEGYSVPTYRSFAAGVQRLDRALAALEPQAAEVGVAPPAGQEWFELLRNKLLPQLDLPPLLVVAIVGGTNIGKSVIFNHLAGEVASASSPLAAGTKHPVCLVPPDLADPDLLKRLFEPFALCAWRSADDPLDDTPENRLYWRVGPTMPPRLLLLDAPDVDSNVTVNWQRARAIRQTADVLVAVLTQQKYNDAAVKQFFRAAVEAQKPIVVVFNQCDGGRSRLLAAMAGHVLPAHRRTAGVGLCGAVRSRGGRRVAAAVLRDRPTWKPA